MGIFEKACAGASESAAPILRRAVLALEDKEFDRVDEFCENVLNIEPENAAAYLGKMLAEFSLSSAEELVNFKFDIIINNKNYQKVIRFGGDEIKANMSGILSSIAEAEKQAAYDAAATEFSNDTQKSCLAAARAFKELGDYKDSAEMAEKCKARVSELKAEAELKKKNDIYSKAVKHLKKGTEDGCLDAKALFETLGDFKDSAEQIRACDEKIEAIRSQAENDKKDAVYDKAVKALKGSSIARCENAIADLTRLGEWKDSAAQIEALKARIEELKAEAAREEEELQTAMAEKAAFDGKTNIFKKLSYLKYARIAVILFMVYEVYALFFTYQSIGSCIALFVLGIVGLVFIRKHKKKIQAQMADFTDEDIAAIKSRIKSDAKESAGKAKDSAGKAAAEGAGAVKKVFKSEKFGKVVAYGIIAVLIVAISVSCSGGGSSHHSSSSDKGYWGSDGYYNPTESERQQALDDAYDWMAENW